MQRPRAPGEAVIRAPPALTLPQNDLQTKQLFIVQSIISQAWPALLAALSFIIATNLLDELFVEVLASYQAMANVSGMLSLTTPCDAFFNSLSKFATSIPSRVISSLDLYIEPLQTPRSATAALSEGLGRPTTRALREEYGMLEGSCRMCALFCRKFGRQLVYCFRSTAECRFCIGDDG